MMKNCLFVLLLSISFIFYAKNESFTPEVLENIQQTVYRGVIVESLKTPIKDFLTHHNTNILSPEIKKVIPQVFVSPKELISIITLLLLQPDLQKKLQIYARAQQKEILQKLFAVIAQSMKDSQTVAQTIPDAIDHIIQHAS
ncbi:hypothetical protein EBR77_00140 [bacterium]|nr:hypothetical protein [bacterium]